MTYEEKPLSPVRPTDLAAVREQLLLQISGKTAAAHGSSPTSPSASASSTATMADSTTTAEGGGYVASNKPLGAAKHIRVITVGAGASGINMVRTLRKKLAAGTYEHVVYEKNREVGGTWLENRYPGCRCDIPSHNYQFSWRKKRDWSSFCAPAEEIEKYLCEICEDEGMRGEIRLEHRVKGMEWEDGKGVWKVRVRKLKTGEEFVDEANFVVDASGILNKWKWPDVPGREDFKGRIFHSADWPQDLEYRGKTVAVIGNGSSGVQIVPAILPDVKKLVHCIRGPTWVVPPRIPMMMMGPAKEVLSQIQLDENENFTPEQIERFKTEHEMYKRFVKATEKEVNSNFPIFVQDSPVQSFAQAKVREFMTAMLGGDPTLCAKLIPSYSLGCRRMTPAPGYLESFRSPKMKLVTDKITKFVPEGFETETGETVEVDVVVCATGFDMSFTPRFPVVLKKDGKKEENLQDRWRKDTPKAYMSVAIDGVPNYFTILGPNAPIAHGSVFTLAEHIAKYIASTVQKCQTQSIKSLSPSAAAVEDYFEHITKFMPRTTWSSGCNSWFKNDTADGPVVATHPGSRIHFFQMLREFRGEDWVYDYEEEARGNRFAWLGNGFASLELEEGKDSTWYLYEDEDEDGDEGAGGRGA
ncbi:uncharacterized protein MKZ38_002515 [Zalerion maritima]|uniref:Uncharacterized protein n=1 Tax=Zalerion maritima TaxID=339359 RepID=A0AAD5RQ68_9PEZI|nr:uncharacterized protein MKZ38_002515 [Zalerion maritima]